MKGNRRRPSGTWTIPRSTLRCAATHVRSSSPKRTRPRRGATRPETTRRVVDLPAALAPTSATISPGPTSSETARSEEHTSELQSRGHLVCRLLLEKKKRSPCYDEQPVVGRVER